MYILNRNILPQYKYSKEEIREAFLKKEFKEANMRERIIYSKFLKECDEEDLETLLSFLSISIENIRSFYKDIPERAFAGVSNRWDKILMEEK